ncbi:MAG: hypothetical protein CML60_08465, partial [Rhodobacteraceae bacterium]|nr:hypothetical protein [Paracoccaceae bacterium]
KMQAQPIDNIRIRFITHTDVDCLPDAQRLARVDIDSWDTLVGDGVGVMGTALEFETQEGNPPPYDNVDQYFGTPIKGYRRTCELFCRESDACAGFQYTPLVVTTANDGTRYESDDAALRRRRGPSSGGSSSGGYIQDTFVEELDDLIYLPDGICQFIPWSDNKIVDGALNECLMPVNGTYVTDGTGPSGTFPTFIDLSDTSNFTYTRPTMFVQKVVPEMCKAVVTDLPVEEAAFNGEYVKSPQRRRLSHPAIWEKSDNTAALVFSSDDTSSECDSWALYE